MHTVYRHTSPSGKVYIGITGMNVLERWDNGRGYRNCTVFNRAIEKYGWDNIKHEILFENLTKEDACEYERLLIKYYSSINKSYNILLGGEQYHGSKYESPDQYWKEYKHKWYIDHLEELKIKSKKRRIENAEKISLAHKEYYVEHRDELLEYAKEYRLSHPEQRKIWAKTYREKHREERNAKNREYTIKNRDVINAKSRRKRLVKKIANLKEKCLLLNSWPQHINFINVKRKNYGTT